MTTSVHLPSGFRSIVANIGIKDDTDDMTVIAADRGCVAAAVFTKSRFAGPSVRISRRHTADHRLRACVVISKNANVATGPEGDANAYEVVAGVAAALGCDPEEVLIASTGVIGQRYPMERVRAFLHDLPAELPDTDADGVARAIMTTDTHPKVVEAKVGAARVVGVSKGVGMIEPDMATLIAMAFTDAEIAAADLDEVMRRVTDRTFNSLSIDTDTSTSDTFVIMASGTAGPVDPADFEVALGDVCLELTRQMAADGEGANKLLVVTVSGARDDDQARLVAKAVVNSPLVKTAVHGADPNWGRVVMAVGKCSDETDIDPDAVRVTFGGHEVFGGDGTATDLGGVEAYLRGDEVELGVDLGISEGRWTVYGCDLTEEYVRFNSEYTT